MGMNEVQKLPHGLYRVFWKGEEGYSLAAVGSKYDGTRWLCCTNWTSPHGRGTDATDHWDVVERVEPITV